MGKLVDKLHAVSQGSNAGMGFLSPARSDERKPRPLGVLVIGGSADVSALKAAVEAGADALVLSGWSPGASSFAALTDALQGKPALWGVEPSADAAPGALKAAAEAGAAFAVVGPTTPLALLLDELKGFDLVATVQVPGDDLGMLGLRAVNLLPAQALLVETSLSAATLARLTVADFMRLRLVLESVRFPSLLTVDGTLGEQEAHLLAELGADGVVLSAASAGSGIAQQVRSVIAALEKTPAARRGESGALLGGLVGAPGAQAAPPAPGRPGKPEPEKDPDRE